MITIEKVQAFLDAHKGTAYGTTELLKALADEHDAYDRGTYMRQASQRLRGWRESKDALLEQYFTLSGHRVIYGKVVPVIMWHAKRERVACIHCNGKGFNYRD